MATSCTVLAGPDSGGMTNGPACCRDTAVISALGGAWPFRPAHSPAVAAADAGSAAHPQASNVIARLRVQALLNPWLCMTFPQMFTIDQAFRRACGLTRTAMHELDRRLPYAMIARPPRRKRPLKPPQPTAGISAD